MDFVKVLDKALANMAERPRDLTQALRMMLAFEGMPEARDSLRDILGAMESDADPVHMCLGRALWRWDCAQEPSWAEGSRPQTAERRAVAYRLLGLTGDAASTVTRRIPLPTAERPVVIAQEHRRWYPPNNLTEFYWKAYVDYLRNRNRWEEASINMLDVSTNEILQRLSDPTADAVYQSKGLVVGYVQSGKTANFTGLIAKAADAGYRLFIVLGGLLDILRNQTQRRIDKELIGKELLRQQGGQEYQGDSEWSQFIEHGALPSELGHFDWLRLTGQEDDFRSLSRGIATFEFERLDSRRPFNDQRNLEHARARLVVIKKNPNRIQKLISDLRSLRSRLDEVPALIIDDESDQASVNTRKPGVNADRTRTNAAIVSLLDLLPRAQYVGYTATPFANVFINPDDAVDLFPKDFIISLPRPAGYMGVDNFYDLGPDRRDEKDPRSNYRSLVRNIRGDDTEAKNLQRAVDSFVLAGAMKLFRADRNPDLARAYKHHTMLVHQSAFKQKHRAGADLVQNTFDAAGYYDGAAFPRLAQLWDEDFAPVCLDRAGTLPVPQDFAELRPFIGRCRDRLERPDGLERHVRIVNGENVADTPDFDTSAVWSILVGGAKLSRGYTVEGLTVSYYRRTNSTSDTLMQMGRWFGYRRGYEDLVRLFIGRHEPLDPKGKKHLDLYEAFEAICSDEMSFRSELKIYQDMEPRILPRQVPPLVTVHRPDLLKPSATNKMYNAELKYINLGGTWSEPTMAPAETDRIGVDRNASAAKALLNGAETLSTGNLFATLEGRELSFAAHIAIVAPGDMNTFLRTYLWALGPSGSRRPALRAQLGFLERPDGDLCIDRWLIIAPQSEKDPLGSWEHRGRRFNVRQRARVGGEDGAGRYKVYSEPAHRTVSEALCRFGQAVAGASSTSYVDERQGVMLLYPVRDDNNGESKEMVTMGFALFFPSNSIPKKVKFGVKDPARPEDVVVERADGVD
jgi:hypothetical protein